jgi:transposase InsO family protein
MQSNRIYCKIRKINPYKLIWKATKEDKISPNLLERKFKDGSPFEIILTDITYLHCKFGTVYLSAAKDSITNEIVAFKIQDNMRISLSTSIIDQLVQLPLHKNVKVHSDQGVHYSAKIFRNSLKINNITQSMSRRGNCWDNAPMESFFGHFKDEVAYQKCETLDQVIHIVNQYMVYYNSQRKQWNLKKMTPVEYRNHLTINTA